MIATTRPSRPVRTTRHSEANDWRTPRWLFDGLADRIPFSIDLCATPADSLCPRFGFGAMVPGDVAWFNPPYGRGLASLLRMAVQSTRGHGGPLVAAVCLLPVRTSTAWWHGPLLHSRQRVFVRGRLRFSGADENAPFDNVVAVFGDAPRIRSIVALRGYECVEWESDIVARPPGGRLL